MSYHCTVENIFQYKQLQTDELQLSGYTISSDLLMEMISLGVRSVLLTIWRLLYKYKICLLVYPVWKYISKSCFFLITLTLKERRQNRSWKRNNFQICFFFTYKNNQLHFDWEGMPVTTKAVYWIKPYCCIT